METHFEVVSPSLHEGGQGESRQNSLLQEPLDSSGNTVNAAAAYLAELHSGDSRRAVRSRLNIAARWLGAADAFSCEWGRLRYVHVLGFMHALADKEGLAARFRPMSLRSFWLRSMRTPDLKRFATAH